MSISLLYLLISQFIVAYLGYKSAGIAIRKRKPTTALSMVILGFITLAGAVAVLVNSLINNIVMPPLGFVLGSAEGLKGLSFSMGTTPSGQQAILHYGTFLNDLINFLVIALVIYYVVHGLGLDKKLDKKK